jgi:pyrimidine operon attenuation protein/uracil phosphoribosyltransferase
MKATQILDEAQIKQRIRRIAYHIHENHYQEKDLVLAGIQESGFRLAELIKNELKQIATFHIDTFALRIDKFAKVQPSVSSAQAMPALDGKVVILVDDVLNSGRTLAFALKPFLEKPVKKIEVAVLVNRAHKRYPVSVDYTGYELATTLSEHIEVNLAADQMAVHLH